MISYTKKPWRNPGKFSLWKNRLISALLLLVLGISTTILFTLSPSATAEQDNNTNNTNVSIMAQDDKDSGDSEKSDDSSEDSSDSGEKKDSKKEDKEDKPKAPLSPEEEAAKKARDSSPAKYAEKIKDTEKITDATRYLLSTRWGAFPIPTSQSLEIDNMSTVTGPIESSVTSAITSLITTLASAIIMLAVFAFSGVLVDTMTKIADMIVASFGGASLFGGNSRAFFDFSHPAEGVTLTVISSLFIIVLSVAIFRNAKADGTPMQQRFINVGVSLGKYFAALIAAIFITTQSAGNWKSGSGFSLADGVKAFYDSSAVETEVGNIQDATSNDANENYYKSIEDPVYNSASGDKAVGSMSSWQLGSMGWIISAFYWLANIFANAVFSIFTALFKVPIDWMASGVNNAARAEKNSDKPDAIGKAKYQDNLACNRYTDALWYAFENTRAYDLNGGTAQVLESIDRIYYDLFIENYSMIYGDNTQSAQNSWCWGLEVYDTSIAPQEWVVHSRTADLYREALGSGNLFSDSSKVVSGSHILPAKMDLVNGSGSKDGIIISSNGEWKNNDKDGSIKALTTYMGRSGGEGSKQAKYYFAACVWKTDGTTKLGSDWWQVRAGGESGGFVGDNQDGYEDQTLGEKDDDPKENTEYVVRRYLVDEDCYNDKVIPSPDGNPKRGFGSESEVAKRWNFAPLKNSILSQVTDTVRDAVTGGFTKLNPFSSDEDDEKKEDEEEAKNPENKFGESRNEIGEIPAHKFWQRANGRANGANSMLALISVISMSIYGLFVLLSLIPAIFINTIMAVLFMAIPFLLVIGAIRFVKSRRK